MRRAQDRARGPERTEREARRSNRAPWARSNLRAMRMCPRSGQIFFIKKNVVFVRYRDKTFLTNFQVFAHLFTDRIWSFSLKGYQESNTSFLEDISLHYNAINLKVVYLYAQAFSRGILKSIEDIDYWFLFLIGHAILYKYI